MGDQLEQFVMNNKDSFNDVEPSDKVWKGVNSRVNRRGDFLQVAWKVAAIVFMVSTIFLLVDRTSEESYLGPQLSEEFQQAEDYYTQLISMKKMEIQEKLTTEQLGEFLNEIDELHVLYVELKSTYKDNAMSDRVVDAMISNLQLRLDILNKQLDILENFKDQKNENESETTVTI